MLLRSLVLALLLLLVGPPQGLAQPAPVAGPGTADLQAIDRVLRLLKDDAGRAALIADLESLRAALPAAEPPASDPPPPPEAPPADAAPAPEEVILTETGLMAAVTAWVGDIGADLPRAALGVPIDQMVGIAGQQIQERLAEPGSAQALQAFAIRAASGWALALLALFGLAALPFVRRRTVPDERAGDAGFWRGVAMRTLFGLLPVAVAAVVLVLWPVVMGMRLLAQPVFLLLAAPVWAAILARRLFHHLLELAAPSRGWRLVVYAQRRLGPWIGALAGLATVSLVLRDPSLRIVLGAATVDLASLLVDLFFNLVALLFVLRHKVAVRTLLIRDRLGHHAPEAGPLEAAVVALARRWHLIAIVFLALNVVARLFGTQSQGFVLQALLSMLFLVIGTMLAAWLRKRAGLFEAQMRRRRASTRTAILCRAARLVTLIGQVAIAIAVVAASLSLWGFDLAAWLATEPGRAILGSLAGIALAILAAWAIWILIDGWIEHTLTPVDQLGEPRPMSNRVRTLLPLLRNFVFVTLTVLTGIAVLANLGVNVAPFLAGAGVVGLAIGFGSQQLVQDVITGLFILLEDTISIGDVIDTGDRAGVVEALTIRTVRIRDGEGALHSIPFSSIKALKNRSRDFGVYMVSVMVAHHTDLQKALDTMREVGGAMLADPAFAPLILLPLDVWGVDEFTPDGIVLKGAIRTRPLQQWVVGRELNRRLQVRFDELGIELAHRQVLPPGQGQPA
ncbi:mechanosensitive ion channel family protein [Geminicoccus roseus]|uniref:mechanosensitive ion channel family protein n=1 Tax=Geminicoccus roseus TaxID=404900 RepID=UPI00048210AD|nr:mechanosensitive ion channel domain-containing protein [Geminicoccus roseus]